MDAKPGDWMIENAGSVAVVSSEGKVIDFGPRGGRDELVSITPTISLVLDANSSDLLRIDAVGELRNVLRVERAVHGRPVLLVSFIFMVGDTLRVESTAVATGNDPGLAAALGERVAWGNVPTWVEGQGYIEGGAALMTDFIGRGSSGTSYALCSTSGKLMARFYPAELPGFNDAPRTGEEVVPVPAGGASARRHIAIAYSTSSLGDAALALPCVRRADAVKWRLPAVAVSKARAEIARCDAAGKPGRPYVHFDAEKRPAAGGDARAIETPRGCYHVRYTAPGHIPGPWIAADALAAPIPDANLPQAGRLRFRVTEGGRSIPARVLVRGAGSTPDPHWGDEADRGAALNVVHAEQGQGQRPLPPGKYRVIITRGFEYTAHEEEISVAAKQTVQVNASLDRVVDTRGYIAADLHLHAAPSPDAPSPLADRIRSLAAAGVEVGVATDHNAVTDYRPVIRELGLEAAVASVIGDEVTTWDLAFGHFNVFPLAAGSPPIPWRGTLPATIFAAARASRPYGAGTVVQVNHPRMADIGYFDVLRMDPSDVQGWIKRSPVADMSFDTIEVFNGDHYNNVPRVEQVMQDWFALLNAGFRHVATGNSDSHKVSFHEAGTPRNLVAVPADAPSVFDERAFIEAVRAGRLVVSSGLFVRLEIDGKAVGSTVPEGTPEIVVRVDAPPWVDIDRVELIRRGERLREWSAASQAGPRPFEWRTREPLRKGDWVIAVARGSKPMPFLHRSGAMPFGFTNPVWIK